MNLHSLILLCVSAAAVFGNTIKPNATDVGADEGQNVKLSCSYSSTGGSDDLFWYRQYGRSKPEFLVSTFSNATDPEVSKVDPRFSVKVTKKEQIHVYLIISSAAVSDSALYYCALRPTVTGNTRTLYKNPSVFNPMRTSNRHRDKDYKSICKLQM
ncbi:T-cell receptor alpha chain V region CTL-F3 [Anabarilius grahami]|nr:T-cell receptor alpha chain V region CTL-F3 [Anabarilius grahami]